jgi:hypothetical protein
MTSYKFRTEIWQQAEALQDLLGGYAHNWQIENWIHQGVKMQAITVSFDSVFSLEDIRQLIHKIEGGDVMLQTVALAENYTGERDDSIE